MKKWFALLLIFALLMTGCGREPAPTEPTTPESTTPAPPQSDLLDGSEPMDGQEHLRCLMELPASAQYCQGLHRLDGAVLVETVTYGDYEETAAMTLTSIRLSDGAVLGEITFSPNGYDVAVKTLGNRAAVINFAEGKLRLYDPALNLTAEYDVPAQWCDWWLSPDGLRLYSAQWETGLLVTELSTGLSREAIPGALRVRIICGDGSRLLVEYVDEATQRTRTVFLDMRTEEVTPVEIDANADALAFFGERLLLQDNENYTQYHLVTPHSHDLTNLYNGTFTQQAATGHLLLDQAPEALTLYDCQGRHLSSIRVPPGESLCTWGGMVWWEEFGGYLLISWRENGDFRLCFWDVSQTVPGEDLGLRPYDDAVPGGYATDPALYRRAAALSETYGLDIRIADQCRLDYDEYYSYAVEDAQVLSDALDELEKALESYPEGYFRQLLYADIQSIRIELIGGLEKKDIAQDASYTSFVAFAQEKGNYYLVVVDVYTAYQHTYYHEFSHITDRRLDWDAQLRPEALYSDAGWMELQPEGFSFSYSYDTLPWGVDSGSYDGWFVDSYSCTFPTEDRARIMEYAMIGWDWALETQPLQRKLSYYSQCIRDCFDTTLWPEITAWEKPLDK